MFVGLSSGLSYCKRVTTVCFRSLTCLLPPRHLTMTKTTNRTQPRQIPPMMMIKEMWSLLSDDGAPLELDCVFATVMVCDDVVECPFEMPDVKEMEGETTWLEPVTDVGGFEAIFVMEDFVDSREEGSTAVPTSPGAGIASSLLGNSEWDRGGRDGQVDRTD